MAEMKKERLYEAKADCCGCGACAVGCPQGIIAMEADEEGFLYPRVTDAARCIGCLRCERLCPVLHTDLLHSQFRDAFAGWCADGSGVRSASGGAADALARQMLSAGGVVYGVAYTDDCRAAAYTRVDAADALEKLRTSKYIQARKSAVYKQVKDDLAQGRRVLFFGLPCDTFAVKRFVGDNAALLTVSLICHGPTTERVHAAYLDEIERRHHSTAASVNVRYKKDGHWKPYYIQTRLANGNTVLQKFQDTDYDTAFRHFKRPSCMACRFRKDKYAADLLIGDFHVAQKGTEAYNAHGVSSLLPLTDAGRALLDGLGDSFVLYPVELAGSISQRAVHSSVHSDIDRAAFAAALQKHGLHAACCNPDVRREVRKTKRSRAVFRVKSTAYNLLKRIKLIK